MKVRIGPEVICLADLDHNFISLEIFPSSPVVARQAALQSADLIGLGIDCLNHVRRPRKLLLPSLDRLGADAQSFSHLAHRIAPILDLGDCIAFELVCEFVGGHPVPLACKITKQGVYKSKC